MVKSQEASSVTNCGLSIHHNSITVLPILYFSQTVRYTLKQKSVSTISLSSVLGYPVVKMLIMHTILKSTTQLQNVCIYDKYDCNAKMYVSGKPCLCHIWIEPGTSRTRSQRYTTRLSRRR